MKKDSITFTIDGLNPAIANALRRIMLAEVPTIAIDEVRINENNSALFNEIISHRLGLIPLSFNEKAEKTTLVLKKEGPCTVYSGDLVSTDDTVKPLYDKIPIVKLLENQKVDLEADAVKGIGMTHAKWQAAIAAYEYKDDKFTFTVESISGRKPDEIFKTALDILETKAKELEEAL